MSCLVADQEDRRETRRPRSRGFGSPRKLKVAFLSQPWEVVCPSTAHAQGSIGIWTYEVARRLAPDCEVIVYSRPDGPRPTTSSLDGVRFAGIRVRPDRVIQRLLERFWQGRPASKPFFWSRAYYRFYAWQAAREIHKEQPDIVHLSNFAQFAPIVRAHAPRAKIVLHMHCDWLSELDRRITRRYLRAVDMVVGCSTYVARDAFACFPTHDCRTVYNGVDLDHFRPRAEPDRKRILFVGRCSPEKGLHVMCEAFNLLAPKHPGLECSIVGPEGSVPKAFTVNPSRDPLVRALTRFYPGDYRAQCRALLDEPGKVSFDGYVPHADLPRRYAQAAIAVSPSLFEPFGMPAVEAMACGRPVVASRVGGLPETIKDGTTGMLVEPNDPAALAAALDRLLGSPDRRRAMGRAARTWAEERFSWDRTAADLLDCYQEAMRVPEHGRGLRPATT